MENERLPAAARNSLEVKGEQKKALWGKWPDGAQTSRLWHCHAQPMAERQKSEISGSSQKSFPAV